MSKKVDDQKRVNDILLGPLERPALKWLAAHMPQWVTPDTLTIIGVIASILIFTSYALVPVSKNFLWLASFGFVLNWFGDSLDGTLARYRHIERPRFGFFIDHSVDAISIVMIFLGLGLSGYVGIVVACLAAIGYLMLAILVYLKTYVTGVFEMTSAKIGPTEIRVLGILINTLVFFIGNPEISLPLLGKVSIFSMVVGGLAVVMMSYFVIKTIIEARKLALLDGRRLERRLEKRQELKAKQNGKEK
ncbi:MAG: CDP-alcohol phosphatidyltransferase family protein, partial [Chloroflexota bacterium]